MAVSAAMNATPSAPAHGQTLTISYSITGNDPVAPFTAQITGGVVVGGQPMDLSTSITMPGTPAQPVTYDIPEGPAGTGLVFQVSPTDPSTFTAVVP